MRDNELLELAAKAAGYELMWHDGIAMCQKWKYIDNDWSKWNPLLNDGDALRLAVTLRLIIDCSRPSAGEPFKGHAIYLDELMSNEELTRRAIVLAAAEIGKRMI